MDRDELTLTIEKIKIEKDDILIVRVDDEVCPEWVADQFVQADVKCPVVVLSKGIDVQKMPPEIKRQIAMIAAGDEDGLALNEWEPVGGH